MSIEVSQLTRFFGRAPAVRQLDMSVPGGSVTGLVGPNGAGKTTLLLMLAALLAPDSGTIRRPAWTRSPSRARSTALWAGCPMPSAPGTP